MYDRCYSDRSSLKESFVEEVEQFVSKASQQDCYHNDGESDVLVLSTRLTINIDILHCVFILHLFSIKLHDLF